MRCAGNFKDDRICDLCQHVNADQWMHCFTTAAEEQKARQKLISIRDNCPHHTMELEERDYFHACQRVRPSYGKWAETCNVSLECEKYKDDKPRR